MENICCRVMASYCRLVPKWCLTLCGPTDCSRPGFMEFSRQEYWSQLPFPSPGNLPNPEIKRVSPALQVDSFPTEPSGKPLLKTGR